MSQRFPFTWSKFVAVHSDRGQDDEAQLSQGRSIRSGGLTISTNRVQTETDAVEFDRCYADVVAYFRDSLSRLLSSVSNGEACLLAISRPDTPAGRQQSFDVIEEVLRIALRGSDGSSPISLIDARVRDGAIASRNKYDLPIERDHSRVASTFGETLRNNRTEGIPVTTIVIHNRGKRGVLRMVQLLHGSPSMNSLCGYMQSVTNPDGSASVDDFTRLRFTNNEMESRRNFFLRYVFLNDQDSKCQDQVSPSDVPKIIQSLCILDRDVNQLSSVRALGSTSRQGFSSSNHSEYRQEGQYSPTYSTRTSDQYSPNHNNSHTYHENQSRYNNTNGQPAGNYSSPNSSGNYMAQSHVQAPGNGYQPFPSQGDPIHSAQRQTGMVDTSNFGGFQQSTNQLFQQQQLQQPQQYQQSQQLQHSQQLPQQQLQQPHQLQHSQLSPQQLQQPHQLQQSLPPPQLQQTHQLQNSQLPQQQQQQPHQLQQSLPPPQLQQTHQLQNSQLPQQQLQQPHQSQFQPHQLQQQQHQQQRPPASAVGPQGVDPTHYTDDRFGGGKGGSVSPMPPCVPCQPLCPPCPPLPPPLGDPMMGRLSPLGFIHAPPAALPLPVRASSPIICGPVDQISFLHHPTAHLDRRPGLFPNDTLFRNTGASPQASQFFNQTLSSYSSLPPQFTHHQQHSLSLNQSNSNTSDRSTVSPQRYPSPPQYEHSLQANATQGTGTLFPGPPYYIYIPDGPRTDVTGHTPNDIISQFGGIYNFEVANAQGEPVLMGAEKFMNLNREAPLATNILCVKKQSLSRGSLGDIPPIRPTAIRDEARAAVAAAAGRIYGGFRPIYS